MSHCFVCGDPARLHFSPTSQVCDRCDQDLRTHRLTLQLTPEQQSAFAAELVALGPASLYRSLAMVRLGLGHLILSGADPDELVRSIESVILAALAHVEALGDTRPRLRLVRDGDRS